MQSQAWKSVTFPKIGLAAVPTSIWTVVLGCSVLLGAIAPAQAEGSRNLFPTDAGFRANLEWRSVRYVNLLQRRTLLRVFARQNEVLFLGSSAVGVGAGDAWVFTPDAVPLPPIATVGEEVIPAANPAFRCSDQRTTTGIANQGFIANRTQELAGPLSPSNPGGYVPCTFTAPRDGIYTVVFLGPAGDNVTRDAVTPPAGTLNPLQTDPGQDTSVAAWDVTVRSTLTATTDIPGRLFTYYLALFTGAPGRPIDSTLFTLTTDGYLYRTGLNRIDPNGFVVYGNRQGFLNNDGNPLNRDLITDNDALSNPLGGITVARPEFPLFFNPPAPDVIQSLNIPAPVAPLVAANSFTFTGTAGANNSLISTGGTFSYTTNVSHVFEIVISRDGQNFDPTAPQNRVLRGVRNTAGASSVRWDGLDNSGNPFPIGTGYQARLTVRAGEYHFPLLDVESSDQGSPFYELLNPPGPNCFRGAGGRCTVAFYDDRTYRTASSQLVGGPGQTVVNEALPGAPIPPSSDLVTGFDTASGQRRFTNFGDKKGLDLWTYYPSPTVLAPLNIVEGATEADLSLAKTVDNPGAAVGQPLTFLLSLTNKGPGSATNVEVTDRLPTGFTFVAATPSQGTFDPATGIWAVGTIAANSTLTLQIQAILTTSDPVTNQAEVTRSDQRDPNSTPNNHNPNEDDQASASLGLPNLRLVKRITAVVRQGQPTVFDRFVADAADPNASAAGWNQAQRLPVGIPRITLPDTLQSGDEVEYTIYFLSDGRQAASGVSLCDLVPAGTSLVESSNQIQLGSAAPTSGGTVLSPLAPLPIGNTCPSQTNANGALIFDLGTVSNTPGSNVGFVRFRVRVN